jgi:putative membrane protein
MVGGKYTYAEVPLFNWIRDTLGTHRNSYDGVGHFAQGFIPAILTREILLRVTPLKRGGWLNVIVVSICLAISALYELIEWWVALLTGTAADAFLGAQGDPWDTQKDMALAFLGAMFSLFTLSRVHDHSMNELELREQLKPEIIPTS